MKKLLLLLYVIFSFSLLYAQEEEVKIIDTKNDRIPILVNGEWSIMDHYKVDALLEENIYSFFELQDKYSSPLKKQIFEKTSEYNDTLIPIFKRAKEDLLKTDYAIFYNLYKKSNYDVGERCFKFTISTITPDALELPNTFTFKNFYTITVPHFAFKLETGKKFGRPYERRSFVTPVFSEEIAVEIEDGMKIHPCPYSLLFVVNIEGLKEQKDGLGFPMPYVLTKAKKVYLYNTDSEEIVANFSSFFEVSE